MQPVETKTCKAKNCQQSHSKHYCSLCDTKDADHMFSQCTQGQVYFHGTSLTIALKIIETGFISSSQGRLGKGVYLTTTYQDALQIAKNRHKNSDGYVVLSCYVKYKKLHIYDDQRSDNTAKWMTQFNCDAVQGQHPPWYNLPVFPELCHSNQRRVRVFKINAFNVSQASFQTLLDNQLKCINLQTDSDKLNAMVAAKKIKQQQQVQDVLEQLRQDLIIFYLQLQKQRRRKQQQREQMKKKKQQKPWYYMFCCGSK